MKNWLRVLFPVALAVLALTACGPSDEEKRKAAAEAAAAEARKLVPMPTNATDTAAWKDYLKRIVINNMQGVKTNQPYMYFVPSGDAQDVQDARQSQLDNVKGMVGRGLLPGNMVAFGGPDSKLTADLAADAFKDAADGSFKGSVVLFVGAAADQDRVKGALTKSSAEYRFVEMK